LCFDEVVVGLVVDVVDVFDGRDGWCCVGCDDDFVMCCVWCVVDVYD